MDQPPLRVLHVISGLDPRLGGPAIAFVGLVEALAAVEGVDVSVAAMWARGDDLRLVDRLRARGIDVRLIGPHWGPLAWHPRVGPEIASLLAATDIVHIHALWEEIQHQAARLAWQRNTPYIVRPCGMLDAWSMKHRRFKKKLYLTWRLRRTLERAAAFHFVSTMERDRAASQAGQGCAIIEPNGIDLSRYTPLPPQGQFRQKWPRIGDRPLVSFVGRVHPGKGLEHLIPAMALDPQADWVLAVIGPDSGGYRQQLERMVARDGLGDRVQFTGILHDKDLTAALVDSDLFCLPSDHENFGVAVIEALATGTPVVVSDRVGIHDQIASAGVGLVTTTDARSLHEALTHWLSDHDARLAAAAKAKAFVRERFDWSVIASNWKTRYLNLIEGVDTIMADTVEPGVVL